MNTSTIRAALDTFQQAANRGTAVHLSPQLVQELRDALKAEPEGEGPSLDEVEELCAEFGFYLPDDEGRVCSKEVLLDVITAAITRWGTPTTPPAPEPPAESLAARPLLEQVSRLGRIGAPTMSEIVVISNRAAAWLRQNPPSQPVAIEPRGCPTPGACSCVESAPPAPKPGEEHVEATAKLVYGAMRFAVSKASGACDWVERGNSLMQEEARRTARAILAGQGRPSTPPAPGAPVQPAGRSGLTWKAAILGLRDVLADQTESAVQPAWQRFRILTAIDLMVANSTWPAPEPGEQPLSSLMAQELAKAEQRHGRFDVLETAERLMRCHSAMSARGDVQSAALCFRAATLLQQQATELAALRGVPVSERLPGPNTKVLAYYFNELGKGRTICAVWVPAKTRVSDSDIDEDLEFEYDYETDQFYWPEGWYETIENWEEFGYLKVYEGKVAYWQPLPKWPANATPPPAPQAGEGEAL